MSIMLIIAIAFVVIGIGAKVRRGTFFRWSNKADAPNAQGRWTGRR